MLLSLKPNWMWMKRSAPHHAQPGGQRWRGSQGTAEGSWHVPVAPRPSLHCECVCTCTCKFVRTSLYRPWEWEYTVCVPIGVGSRLSLGLLVCNGANQNETGTWFWRFCYLNAPKLSCECSVMCKMVCKTRVELICSHICGHLDSDQSREFCLFELFLGLHPPREIPSSSAAKRYTKFTSCSQITSQK